VTRVTVLGAGSWGTAFGTVLADAGSTVTLVTRDDAVARAVSEAHENPRYFPAVTLPATVSATTDAARALEGADVVVFAIPSQTLRSNLEVWRPLLPPESLLLSLMKGVERGTSKLMSEVIREVADVPDNRVAVVSGPNLAREIIERQPAASVVACTDLSVAQRLQVICNSGYFRPYTNTDVVGCELGGAVKNVIALAVGMAAGMGFGDNARASLITRGLAETARLGAAMGADPLTFSGLAGLGDLVATCSSPLSRNRTFGENLGKGMTVDEVVAITKQTAEGVKSCRSILELAGKHDVDMPITEAVVGVVEERMTVQEMLLSLISRDPKHERESPA
jgi:glycerol-3-phosphate dehydrogenase (NAD(P)+)